MSKREIENIVEHYQGGDRDMVLKSYTLAENALKDKVRGNNHPFIEHPLGVATILSEEVGLMANSVSAVFLHEANRFQTDNTAELNNTPFMQGLKGEFPEEVIEIVRSLNNISNITLQETSLDPQIYRKLIISYSTDPRVVIIKIADRLEVMRNLHILPQSKHRGKIMETILLYIPLAHQLGLYNLKKELEDLFLKYSEPEQYRAITNSLKAREREREQLIKRFINPLQKKLDDEGIQYTFKGRTKSAYSIWKKMQAQKVPFEKVYDLYAVRIIIESPNDRESEHALCWKVYSLVTEEYTPDPNRLRDWLSVPKENGYESLHTTVTTNEGTIIEVQIRTTRMDIIAEQGHASHWSYKGIKSDQGLNVWLNKVREMMEHPQMDDYQQVSPQLLGEVFVFTPNGDLRQLPQGATLLDFAFDIHTNLGIKCSGGRINGKMVSIKEELKTGDIVEIISNKNQKPNPNWLNIVITSKARTKIKQKIKEEENKKAAAGKEILFRRLRNWKLELSDENLAALVKKLKYKTINEFFGAIGNGELEPLQIKEFLLQDQGQPHNQNQNQNQNQSQSQNLSNSQNYSQSNNQGNNQPQSQGNNQSQAQGQLQTQFQEQDRHYSDKDESNSKVDYIILDSKLNNIGYKMAKCCNPIFGDDVFGFVTINDGIKIHRISCPNAARLIETYPYRIQKVRWRETTGKGSFQVTVKIVADHDASPSSIIFSTINEFKASIRSFYVVDDSKKGAQIVTMTIHVASNLELDKITASLKKAKGIRQITRL